jgi:hypothetical protein
LGDNPLYDGLNPGELSRGSPIIIPFEAFWYCKQLKKNSLRFSEIKTISNNALTVFTNGVRTDFGGTWLHKHILRYEREGLFHREKRGAKETKIEVIFDAIEKEHKRQQAKYLFSEDNNLSLYRIVKPPTSTSRDSINRWRGVTESIVISDNAICMVTKAKEK